MKRCIHCGELKPLFGFSPDKNCKDGVRNDCKVCRRLAAQKRREENPRQHKEAMRLKYANNAEYYREKARRWNANNPERKLKNKRKSDKKRRSTVKGKLNHSMNTRMLRSLKPSIKAGRRWEELVGYTVDTLKQHIEKLFKPGMTWENYGTVWSVDHKIPIAVFNFERPEDIDFRICWSLKNLQPLEVKENMKKNARIEKPFQPSLAIGG